MEKPTILFDCKQYSITRIPLNLRVDIKLVMRPKRPQAGIDRDLYCHPSDKNTSCGGGIEFAKELAEWMIEREFIYDPEALKEAQMAFASRILPKRATQS